MKKLYYMLMLLVLAHMSKGQSSISPDVSTEQCPSTNINFSVTIPGYDPHIYGWTNGPTVVSTNYPPSGYATSTTFTFVGKFQDLNVKQSFKVEYKLPSGADTMKIFDFTKVKSLFFYVGSTTSCPDLQPNQGTISVPVCEIQNKTISFDNIKWQLSGESSVICFGTITTYEYLLPAGWSLGGTVSTGSNWIPGSNNVSVTSDAGSGNGGYIYVRPRNGCASGLANNYPIKQVYITRPAPSFSLTPMSAEITCGTPLTQTYTVNQTGSTNCTVTYLWDLGATNGWTYNGNPAPDTPFLAPSSITLVSETSPSHIGNVKVTPLIAGMPQTQLVSTSSFHAPNFAIIGGSSTICTGTSSAYSLYNAPSGVSIFWGTTSILPNYGATVVSVDNPTGSSTTLTKINSGVVDLVVSLTDACTQVYPKTRSGIAVGGYSSAYALSGYTLAYPPCYTQGCTPSAVPGSINSTGPYGTTVYTGTAYMNTDNYLYIYNTELASGTWSLVSGNPFSWSSSSGNSLTMYPGDSNPVTFRLSASNSCGSLYYDFTFYPETYHYSSYYYIAFPNPSKNMLTIAVDEPKLAAQKLKKSADQDIREIVIANKMGMQLKKRTAVKGTRTLTIDVSDLRPDIYVVRIFNGKNYQSLQFIKK